MAKERIINGIIMPELPPNPDIPDFTNPGFVLRPWQADAVVGLLNKIKNDAFVNIVAPRRAGKTVLSHYIVKMIRDAGRSGKIGYVSGLDDTYSPPDTTLRSPYMETMYCVIHDDSEPIFVDSRTAIIWIHT